MASTSYIRVTHTGLAANGSQNVGAVFINDLDTGMEHQHRKVKCYVPRAGFIDIPLTSRSILSLETGTLKKFVTAGVVTAVILTSAPTSLATYSNGTRPAANTLPAGSMIFNTDDKAPNFSDGAAWYDAMGNLT